MALPYPVTSYAGRVVDLTGGRLDKFENSIIKNAAAISAFFKTYNALSKLNERELSDIGLNKTEILKVSLYALKGNQTAAA